MEPRDPFFELADSMFAARRGGEQVLLSLEGEDSDFVRWNGGRVRQAGTVIQRHLSIRLIDGRRHASARLSLGDLGSEDRARTASALQDLRTTVAEVPADPHLLWNQVPTDSERIDEATLPSAKEAIADIAAARAGVGLVGIHAQGPVYAGFAASTGQRNWFQIPSFHFEWSLYARGDKATKQSYAGRHWDREALGAHMAAARQRLSLLEAPGRRIPPGRYRAWLAPAAVAEIIGLLAWGAFGLKNWRTRRTPILRALDGKTSFAPSLHLTEDCAHGLAPAFSPLGFVRPDCVTLIDAGAPKEPLVCPRSAQEYGVPTNGASDDEMPISASLAAGSLPTADVLRTLGTGLWVSNLWYLNWSDRAACRATGMTRFATMWVEDGTLRGPIDVMRFDSILTDLLGDQLVALGAETELMPDSSSYERRSTSSVRAPGLLVDGLQFTL